jgi:hypothetical protein
LTPDFLLKVSLSAAVIVFFIGVSITLIRQSGIWILIGMIMSLKAVIAGAMIMAVNGGTALQSSAMIGFVAGGLIFALLLSGMAVILRTKRFGSKSDLIAEKEIRH